MSTGRRKVWHHRPVVVDTRSDPDLRPASQANSDAPSDRPLSVTRVDAEFSEPQWLREASENLAAMEGLAIGRFRVLEKVGAGGMGVVFAAYDDELDRKVAVKLVLPDRNAKAKEQQRLLQEARAMARLDHPNVATVFETGEHQGGVYVAMEFIRGLTLRDWLREPRQLEEILDVFIQAGRGLAAAHEAGLVHRDFKPDNVMIDERGRARVLDFGLALSVTEAPTIDAESETHSAPSGPLDQHQRTVAFAGTPAYMAPEVLGGAPASPITDQFSFCVALWEGLFGERPFQGQSLATLVSAIDSGVPTVPSAGPSGVAKVPGWMQKLVARGLASKPEQRWPSLGALLHALQAGDPKRRMRRGLGLAAAALAVASVAAVVQSRRARETRQAIESCEALAADLDWSEARAQRVHASIANTGADDADPIATEARDTLGRFATNWREARVQVCRESVVDQTLEASLASKMVACLEQRQTVFDATVETFLEIEPGMVTRVSRTMNEFDNLDACRDPKKLALLPELPEDPEQRAAVRELELSMARTLHDEHFGTYDRGLELSNAALERARQLDYLPSLAKAKYRVAVFLEKQGKYDAAVQTWSEAFHDAVLVGFDQLAADAAAALAFTEGYQLARYDTGIRWSELSGVYGERLGDTDGLREGRRLDVMAVLLEMKGELQRSAETHERSLAMRRAAVGDKHSSIGYGLLNYAFVLEKLGEPQRARDMVRESLAIFELHFGRDNPTTASVMMTLANMQRKVEAWDQAAALYDEVEGIWHKSLPPEHPDFGDLHNSVANLLRDQGKLDAAAERHRKALAIHEKALDPKHPDLAWTRVQLAEVLMQLERPDGAQPLFSAALTALEGKESNVDTRARARFGLAQVAEQSGRSSEAKGRYRRARADFERAEGDFDKWIARCDAGLGRVGDIDAG